MCSLLCHRLDIDACPVQHDPFSTSSSLGADERLQAGKQRVCSLQTFLELAASKDKLVIFDLRQPPTHHPYRDAYINRTLEVIKSTIHPSKVRQWNKKRIRRSSPRVLILCVTLVSPGAVAALRGSE